MAEEQPAEIIFRASKRRKVLRKATQQDGEENAHSPSPVKEEVATEIPTRSLEREDDGIGSFLRIQRKPGARKSGIAFSSMDNARRAGQDEEDNMALVLVSESGSSEMPKHDRFVRPTGRAEVTEDKHMYVLMSKNIATKGSTNSVGWHT